MDEQTVPMEKEIDDISDILNLLNLDSNEEKKEEIIDEEGEEEKLSEENESIEYEEEEETEETESIQEDNVPKRGSFKIRSESMGLTKVKDSLLYEDDDSIVVYKTLYDAYPIIPEEDENKVQSLSEVPLMSLYIRNKRVNGSPFLYCGTVSTSYKFVGNQIFIDKILDVLREKEIDIRWSSKKFNGDMSMIYAKIGIGNQININRVGDVTPIIEMINSYNRTRKQILRFGISINKNNKIVSLPFTIGSMILSSRHLIGSTTFISEGIDKYVEWFSGSIESFITINLEKEVEEEKFNKIIYVLKNIQKKSEKEIKNILFGGRNENDVQVTNWDLFVAICMYTSKVKNFNTLDLFTNVAERVLIFPENMKNVLRKGK